ncbi:hypothetical protein BS50DRAFT_331581 [Corynespora cassiicola Philippines]|uniref:Uncharacterized protein n=1 Tax=Corynespora cassiicola Philippines TaxID=1448308 RepID=A0A2T2NUI7_CORCC|nr:hypothetical protein BS50DRAFT_331581 [Corynespora cassiicola Philippines]
MEKRFSSPSARPMGLRPRTQRQRSNSFPIVEALGCSTPEAELILAEGRAAVRSRQARRGRRNRSMNDKITTFRPQDHIQYLSGDCAVSEGVDDEPVSPADTRGVRHSRNPSTATDRSTSTVIGPAQPLTDAPTHAEPSPASPLGDYSANLASFIRSQLSSIPSYRPTSSSISPRSCPDLTFQAKSPPQSPARPPRRHADMPQIIEIPPVQPPLRSAFSAWSSTDDETEAEDDDDDIPPVPEIELTRKDSKASNYTPSVLGYYQSSNNSSFLFSSTPLEEDMPDTAKGFTFPNKSAIPRSSAEPRSPSQDGHDYPSSSLSSRPQLTSSSAPSLSSASTASYFECKRPISLAPGIKDRIIAAVTPPYGANVVPALSPFEGGALANVHDMYIENHQRVCVDGMSFDMLRDFNMPRVTTPC